MGKLHRQESEKGKLIIKEAYCDRCNKKILDDIEVFTIQTNNKLSRFYLCRDCHILVAKKLSETLSLQLRKEIDL